MGYPYTEGRHATYAQNIGDFSGVAGGYLRSPNAYHPWSNTDWQMFKTNPKVPIFVAGTDGEKDGNSCVQQLQALNIPRGCIVGLDMGIRTDDSYRLAFGKAVQSGADNLGWPVLVRGSYDVVFNATGLSGYWVADLTGSPHMVSGKHVMATQWAEDIPPGFDITMWKDSAVRTMWT